MPVAEIVRRYRPKPDALKPLFIKSRNLCAFPGCTKIMMNANNRLIGEVCHIEAAERGGPRFNENMTNEQRRAESNLMLMCRVHHRETDDKVLYPTAALKEMKRAHEALATGPQPLLEQMVQDWTALNCPLPATNLGKVNRLLGWGNTEDQLQYCVAELGEFLDRFVRTPLHVRKWLTAIVGRMYNMRNTNAVSRGYGCMAIVASDLEGAFHQSAGDVVAIARQFEVYGLGGLTTVSTGRFMDDVDLHAFAINNFPSDWPFWFDAAQFCEMESLPLSVLTEEFDFAVFDD